ncbi:hypothetical protein V5F77_23200 [Xanthobacter sp. DSM 24535]|jgi:hypothetical protein|uniref:DUF2946 domain-containing protein n=1 Tax=Aquabacter spiritensis TaxID=933073 RepID=A0A4R3LNH5_9HYPH|nr:hypothetical protein [Aquabacter spiritensis]OYX15263.1 MAG: hypothetical protein B7Z15_01160 [Rhizobiales bacterium 32-66-8]TCT01902.1 hypothetical protein EDC64_116101 [Aquabacter spiritensis]
MIRFRQAIGHVRLLSAVLVAAAMLLAPLAQAMPVQCHDHAEDAQHATIADGHGAAVADHHDEHDGTAQMTDHGACCELASSIWGIAIGSTDTAIQHLKSLGHHPLPSDRVFPGLAVPPGLHPPRFPI